MKREREFVKNSIVLSIGTVIPKLTSVVILPIITGCLSKSEYGTYDLITILVSLILPVATLEMQAAAFRYLVDVRGQLKEQKKVITNIMVFTVPICILALFILFFFLLNIELLTRILILVYFFIDIMLITERQIARGLGMNGAYSMSAAINAVSEMLLMILFLSGMDQGLHGALAALIISQGAALLYIIVKTKLTFYVDFSLVSIEQIKLMLGYAWPLIPNSLSSWVMRASDRLVLSWLMGVEANAIYAVANKLPNIFNMIQGILAMAWQENASISVNDKDSGEYFGKMFEDIFDVLVGGMALLVAFTPITFKILIRGDYDEAYNHILILYLAAMFSTISSYMGGIYIAHAKSKSIGITTTLAAIANFLIDLFTVKFIGIYAASLSTLISYIGLALYRMHDVQKFQKIKFRYKKIAILLIVLAGMTGLLFIRDTRLDVFNMTFSVLFAYGLNRTMVSNILKTLLSKKKASKQNN